MKSTLILAGVIAASLLSNSAEAQSPCIHAKSCDSALKTCIARRNAGLATVPCEAAVAECRKTGTWHGRGSAIGSAVFETGEFHCRMTGY